MLRRNVRRLVWLALLALAATTASQAADSVSFTYEVTGTGTKVGLGPPVSRFAFYHTSASGSTGTCNENTNMVLKVTLSACSAYAVVYTTPQDIAPFSPIELIWTTSPPCSLWGLSPGCGGPSSGDRTWMNGPGVGIVAFGFDGMGGCTETFGLNNTYTIKYNQVGPESCTCTTDGSGQVPTDGAWHFVGNAGCQTPNGDAHDWTAVIYSATPMAFVEGLMVANAGNPASGSGPNLIVRAIGLKPCPPNCPPPDPCLKCIQDGHSISECQAAGACPEGCPPYCPPPPGCPKDPSKCPPPPKCPPYCPPPPGCPEDPSKCVPGCPPVCPPPPDCPPKCPEPPPCPPNCETPCQ